MPGQEPMRCLPTASVRSQVFKEVCILRMSLLLCQDPPTGCLVVWWDVVMATLKSVQFQTKLTDPIRMELNLNLALAVP